MPSRISQIRSGQLMSNSQPQQHQPQPQVLNSNYINQLKNMIHSDNPIEFLARQALQNPQFKSIVNNIKDGGDPRAIAERMAQERGINLEDLIKQLSN